MSLKCLKLSLSCLLLLLTSFILSANCLTIQTQAAQTINYQFNWGKNVQTLDQKIEVACEHFGCNSGQLIRVMNCESEGKNIPNKSGVHSGIFQYTSQTWANFSQSAGIPNANIWDIDAQIYTTSWAFSNNLSSHWTCK